MNVKTSTNNDQNEIDDELAFWEDYVIWWEKKYNRPAGGRLLETLMFVREKYNQRKSTKINPH